MLSASHFELVRNHLADVAAPELSVAPEVEIPVRAVPLSPLALLTSILAALDHLQPKRAGACRPLLYHLAVLRRLPLSELSAREFSLYTVSQVLQLRRVRCPDLRCCEQCALLSAVLCNTIGHSILKRYIRRHHAPVGF
jgi:hypothetical protein